MGIYVRGGGGGAGTFVPIQTRFSLPRSLSTLCKESNFLSMHRQSVIDTMILFCSFILTLDDACFLKTLHDWHVSSYASLF